MNYWEGIFLYATIAGYATSFLMLLVTVIFKKNRLESWASIAAGTGFIFHSAAIICRWWETGHLPVMHTYENSLSGAWVMMLICFCLRLLFPASRSFAPAVAPIALLLLGNGIQTGAELQPLEPAFRSKWIYVHVTFAWLAFCSYVTAFAAGSMYLTKKFLQKVGRDRLPDFQLLDELSLRLILFGVFAHAVMIGSGAIWAYGLWGRYWGWDPVETWSLITWLVYSANLHLRITLGWSGNRGAWLAVISLSGMVLLFFGFGHGLSIHTEMLSR